MIALPLTSDVNDRDKSALITDLCQLKYRGNGALVNKFGTYREAMDKVICLVNNGATHPRRHPLKDGEEDVERTRMILYAPEINALPQLADRTL